MRFLILIFPFCFALGCDKPIDEVTVLYFNDSHHIGPVIDKYGNRGGVARLKTIVDQERERNPNCLVLFGGDLGGGTLFGGIFHGFPMVESFNGIPIDIASFGQHDFDFGVETTEKLVDESDFQWVATNLTYSDGSPFKALPQYIIQDIGDISIGVIGLIDALNTTIPNGQIVQGDLIKSAKVTVEKLKDEGVDFIIAITQTPLATNKEVLKSIESIDLIFTEEVSESETVINLVGKKAIIATCGNMGSVAKASLKKYPGGVASDFTAIPLDTSIVEEPNLRALQEHYLDSLENLLSEEVAFADKGFSKDGSRQKENALGNLITDAYRDHYNSDVAFMNGGGIRSELPQGSVDLKSIYSILPFGNHVCLAELDGRTILDCLQIGLRNYQNRGGDFIQVSGLSYKFKIRGTLPPIVSEVMVGKEKLSLDKKYKVAMPSFMLLGGGEFNPIPSDHIISGIGESPKDVEVFATFLKRMREVYPITSGRIIVIGE